MSYRGFKFTTNNNIDCLVVIDKFSEKYILIDIDNYNTIASDNYENIENLIKIIKEKF